ncbi:tetratricopeptide repeat protein [Tsuneonella flava]|uniref:tetratricopeptide repeat protein n=1 Tax=Tsuneonella flava TaxID=2055955 RepID=UPI00167FE080|nr:tetratricopeptide repeat protein [Tsuneonella flava]
MNLLPLRQQALDAHLRGDTAKSRELVLSAGPQAMSDPLMLQLLAIGLGSPPDERVLYEFAATDTEIPDADAWFNRGVVEDAAGRIDRASLHYAQALRIDPRHHGSLNNLSDLLRRQRRYDEAWQRISQLLDAGGNPAGLELRIAKIADDCGKLAEARHWFAAAEERSGHAPAIVWEHAMQQLRDEEFPAGWDNFEHRRTIFPHDAMAIVSYSMPEWSGDPLNGRSLLVHKEQGLGDQIMFASCLGDLPCDPANLHLAVSPPLARLFAASFPEAHVWSSVSTTGREGEEFQPWLELARPIDCQIPIGSLPRHLRREGFARPQPYLSAPEADIAIWRNRLLQLAPESAAQFRCGLVTVARRDGVVLPGEADGNSKTVPSALVHRFDLPGIAWFGLHDKSGVAELSAMPIPNIVDTSDWLFDLADTAALIACLDVVVAVDTAVAHLAAAMGKPVLLMLRRSADWRWGRKRRDSYWYPDVRVFRQTHEGDWAPVIEAVAERLALLRDRASGKPARNPASGKGRRR